MATRDLGAVPLIFPEHRKARNSRLRILAFGNLAFAAAVSIVMFLQITSERTWFLEDAKSDAAMLSDLLAEQAEQMFVSVDFALASLASTLNHHGNHAEEIGAMLAETRQDLPVIDALLVFDADGTLRAESGSPVPGDIDFSADPIFTTRTAGPSGGPYLSVPRLGGRAGAKGRGLIYMSRRMTDGEGQFAGVVAAAISIERIAHLYDRFRIGEHGIAALVRNDGEVLTRSPFSTDLIGSKVSDEILTRQHGSQATRHDFTALAAEDGRARIFATASLSGVPAFVYVAVSVPERLAAWNRGLLGDTGFGLLTVLAFAGFTIGVRRQILLSENLRDQRLAHLQRLANLSELLMRCTSVQDAMRVAVRQARSLIRCEAAQITLHSCGDDDHETVVSSAGPLDRDPADPGSAGLRAGDRNAQRQAAERGGPAGAADGLPGTPSMVHMPLIGANGKAKGLIRVWGQPGQTCTREEWALVQRLGHLTSLSIQRIRMSEEATRLKDRADQALATADRSRATEAKLRRRLETILISIRDAVFSLDEDWRFLYLNPRAEEYLEQMSSDVIGRSIWGVLPEATGTTLHANLMKAVAEKVDVDFQFFYSPLERWFDVRAFPQEEGGVTVYFHDISIWIAKEEELRHAQKMEAVGQLTGGVAHDFNNLLTVIIGNTEMVLDDFDEGSRNHRLLSMTSKAADQAAELTQRLLAFSRRQPLSPRIVDIKALLDDLAPLLQRTIGEQHEVRIVAPDRISTAMIDPMQLENAIINLVLNARDAMPDGGPVRILVSEERIGADTPDPQLRFQPGRYISITISDTGIGMSEQVKALAYDPFFTTKEVGRGSGLGLSMVFGFVNQSGGHVRIDSEVGKGTCVSMYLPVAGSEAPSETRKPLQVAAWRGTENILVVEDDPLVRSYTRSTLLSLGYAVTAVADGETALAILRTPEMFDLVICDVILGGSMNGPQFAERALARNPGLKILYISGYAERVIYEQRNLDPAANLLTKPFRRAELSVRVREILAGA